MGKQRTRIVKRRARQVYDRMPDEFTEEFEKNREKLKELKLPITKVNRNIMAGYLTDLAEEEIL